MYLETLPQSKIPQYKETYLKYAQRRNNSKEILKMEKEIIRRKDELVEAMRNCSWSEQAIEDILEAGPIFKHSLNIVCDLLY